MARSTQFGGGPIGSVNLGAGGENPLSFRDMPEGPCEGYDLVLGLSLKSTGAAFNAVIDTGASMAAEGVDDVDLVLDAVYSKLNYFWDKHTTAFNMACSKLRTVLAFLELRDIIASILNGTSIPVSTGSALAVLFHFHVPVQLNHLVEDGLLFANGSERLKTGTLFLTTNANITPNVVLANGTAAVSANVIRAVARGGVGDRGDVGNVWNANRQLGLPTVHNFELDRPRIALLDVLPASTNTATGISIGDFESLNPTDFAAYFQSQRLGAQGNAADITARVTPYMWPSPRSRVDDLVARMLQGPPRLVIASGVSNVGVYDISVVQDDGSAHQGVAARVGGGGAVDTAPVKPQSVPAGARVPAAVAHFLPRRIAVPGSLGTAATKVGSAGQAGAHASQRRTARESLISVARGRK